MEKINFLGFMRRKNISQTEFAKNLGVSSATVSMYCNGKSGINFEKVGKLIEMGITATELFGEEFGKKLLENSENTGSEKDFEEKVVAVLNKVSNSGTIQIGVRG